MKIGKVVATEKAPSTVDTFYFWTDKQKVLRPFDVITVKHLKNSMTFGVVEEISHITDSASSLAGFISSDFGDVDATLNMHRVGMNYVKARVVGNTEDIYTPVLDGYPVSLANEDEVKEALGLSEIQNRLPCGYITMYDDDPITIPVHFNSHFLIGPEGAHLNISGISGLASKTSYAMFLLKAIQNEYYANTEREDSVAFVILNVKGRDLLALDERNDALDDADRAIYELLGIPSEPFENVRYFYPYAPEANTATYAKDLFGAQKHLDKAFQYGYTYELDKDKIDMLFASVDDSTGTMESIVAHINSSNSEFASITDWGSFRDKLGEYRQKGDTGKDKEISVSSWRKFSRHFNRIYEKTTLFNDNINEEKGEIRLEDAIAKIQRNNVFVIDIAKLGDDMQGFVFGDVINAIYDLKLGQTDRDESEIPSKIIVFVDELNKYASNDVPKDSPVLRRLLEVTERGRSLGIILFSVEQFRSVIHPRVKGNCATNAYGRTNAIEVAKSDYNYIPPVFKSMITRLGQGEYVVENPAFRSLLNIKFPKPVYRQFPNCGRPDRGCRGRYRDERIDQVSCRRQHPPHHTFDKYQVQRKNGRLLDTARHPDAGCDQHGSRPARGTAATRRAETKAKGETRVGRSRLFPVGAQGFRRQDTAGRDADRDRRAVSGRGGDTRRARIGACERHSGRGEEKAFRMPPGQGPALHRRGTRDFSKGQRALFQDAKREPSSGRRGAADDAAL